MSGIKATGLVWNEDDTGGGRANRLLFYRGGEKTPQTAGRDTVKLSFSGRMDPRLIYSDIPFLGTKIDI